METINRKIKYEDKTKNLINLINLISGIFMLFALSSSAFSSVFAADWYEQNFTADKVKHIEYDFDEVNVLYAVQFEAGPETHQARSGNVQQDEWYSADQTWLKDIISDSNPNITVLFGAVELKNEGQVLQKEEFIKISGEKGSRRFLLNSASYDYYEGTNNLMRVYTLFWSAKILKGNKVIKDFTKPTDSVIFMRKLLPSGEATNFYLFFFTGDQETTTNIYNDETFPIMYSFYKPIAEYGKANVIVEDNTDAGKIYKEYDNFYISTNKNTTTENNTAIESNNISTGNNTSGNNTTSGSDNTANSTAGNNASAGSNITATSNNTTRNNTTSASNITATSNNTAENNTTNGNNNTANNNAARDNTTAGGNNTAAGTCTINTTNILNISFDTFYKQIIKRAKSTIVKKSPKNEK